MQISATAFMFNQSVNCLAEKYFNKTSGIFPGGIGTPQILPSHNFVPQNFNL